MSAFSKGMANLTQVVSILVMRWWVRFAFRGSIRRVGPLPSGACVYASNHRSFADPPFVACWSRVPVAFFARSNLWDIPVIRQCLQLFDGIPVDRDNPGISSMKGAVERLRQGMPILVFPEGTRTRSGRVGPLRDGPALFARRAGVPLIPVYLYRSESVWPRGCPIPLWWGRRVEIRFGRPIVPPPGLDPRSSDAWVTKRLALWMQVQERSMGSKHPSLSRPPRNAP